MPGTKASRTLFLNGKAVPVPSDTDLAEPLAHFLRRTANCQSVKVGCEEGGCGTCAVELWSHDANGVLRPRSVASCLTLLGSVVCGEPTAVYTSEGLGNSRDGYDATQERIAAFHGSQCGFCTPGMVVACHAALAAADQRAADRDVSVDCAVAHAEFVAGSQTLGGNLCRCTGYRPIVDACKSLCEDVDLEDLGLHCAPLASLDNAAAAARRATLRESVSALLTQPPVNSPCGGGGGGANGLSGGTQVAAAAMQHGPEGSRRTWAVPATLSQLLVALRAPGGTRMVAGNTGAGVYKEKWDSAAMTLVDVSGVAELRALRWEEGCLHAGGAVTLAELADTLDEQGNKQAGIPAWRLLAAHIRRVAGPHVRSAATLAGHLVLARDHLLESDLVPALLVLGAHVGVAAPAAPVTRWIPVSEYVDPDERRPAPNEVCVALRLPELQPGDRLWLYKVAERYSNAVSLVTAAAFASLPSTPPRFALGYAAAHGRWRCGRMKGVETALAAGAAAGSSSACAVRALREAREEMEEAGTPAATMRVAEGVLAKAMLAVQFQVAQSGEAARALLDCFAGVEAHGGAPLAAAPRGSQRFKDTSQDADNYGVVGAALQKEKALLQASGEAQYTSDLPPRCDALYAAYVTSSVAKAALAGVDATPALGLPGVVRYVGARDLPAGGRNVSAVGAPGQYEPVFAEGEVQYHGQPIGLVLATSQAAARRGAAAVAVSYRPVGAPLVDLHDAIEQGEFHDYSWLGPMGDFDIAKGDVDAALRGSAGVVAGTLTLPSQSHMYLEPQVSVARPEEGGGVWVAAATHMASHTHQAIANACGLQQKDVTLVVRRLGGSFGGKATRSVLPATAAAVAALASGREVRLAVNRNTDLRMNGGRNLTRVQYEAGADSEGRLQGLRLRIYMLGSVFSEVSWLDPLGLKKVLDGAYRIPAAHVTMRMTKCNVHPFTPTRGPGEAQAAYIMQYVMHRIAQHVGRDLRAVHEVNMIGLQHAETNAEGARHFPLALSPKVVPEAEYTLPRIWATLLERSGYAARRKQVAAFNAAHLWRKRGLSIMPTRASPMVGMQQAAVSIYPDGSVLIAHSGVEVGQGLITKIKQVAVMELSRALPQAQRPMPLELVGTTDFSSFIIPSAGITGGSGTSEATCQAVMEACRKLVADLRPHAEALGPDATWRGLIQSLFFAPGFPGKLHLHQSACYTGGEIGADGTTGSTPLMYSVFGAAVVEVEVDVLTGERSLLRADIVFDVGNSVNPAVDIGQIEGAFAMGCGIALTEAALFRPRTGEFLSDSTWNYKPPSLTCVPRELHVHLLEDSPLTRGINSSKACGEPPLLLSAAVFTALHSATAEAAAQLAELAGGSSAKAGGAANGVSGPGEEGANGVAGEQHSSLIADWSPPATVPTLRAAMGGPPLHELLAKVLT